MVYINEKNGKINGFVVTCNCGCCNGLEFKIVDNIVFVSSFSGDFYNKQGLITPIQTKIHMLKSFVKNNGVFCDCILDKKDIVDFLYAINNINFTAENNEIYKNQSYVFLYKEIIDNNIEDFGIAIKSKTSLIDNLLCKDYKNCEITYNSKNWKKFVNVCNNKFKNL